MLRFIYILIIGLFLGVFINSPSFALQSEWSLGNEAKIRIISPYTNNNNISEFYLGLEYQLEDGWKTYWKAPGEGGFPQTLDWKKSINISSLEILWPTPEEFEILGIKSIGYKNEVIFPLKLNILDLNKETFFSFDVNFLICKDICIPGKANLELLLPPGEGKTTNHYYYLEKSISEVPITAGKIDELEILNVESFKDDLFTYINVEANSKTPFKNPKIFLDSSLGLPVVDAQYSFSSDQKKINANFKFDKILFKENNFDLKILLKDRLQAVEYVKNIIINNTQKTLKYKKSFFYIFFISLLGGFILNFMPCVLPVLSLKLMSVLNKNNSINSIRKNFFSTSLGIIISFFLLSLILLFIRYLGFNIGWGMQFQNPIFLMIIIFILFLFALNLFGLYDIMLPQFISRLIIKKNSYKIAYKDFFNGFFATILATPCSAPFVGTAITLAFTQSYLIMIFIFISMGIGMSFPYILTAIFPSFIFFIPKPGPWVNIFKFILGLLLIGTILWIVYILTNHVNFYFLIISTIILLLNLFFFIFLKKHKNFMTIISLIIFIFLPSFQSLQSKNKFVEDDWIDFNDIIISSLIEENFTVFVDITADWCATCQFNKYNVINSSEVKNNFKNKKVIKIRGDWTKPNKKIENFLNNNNRFGIPFNIIYSKFYKEGIILPEILTVKEVLKTIEIVEDNNNN